MKSTVVPTNGDGGTLFVHTGMAMKTQHVQRVPPQTKREGDGAEKKRIMLPRSHCNIHRRSFLQFHLLSLPPGRAVSVGFGIIDELPPILLSQVSEIISRCLTIPIPLPC